MEQEALFFCWHSSGFITKRLGNPNKKPSWGGWVRKFHTAARSSKMISGWWFFATPLKNISQLGWWDSLYISGKITKMATIHHQPVIWLFQCHVDKFWWTDWFTSGELFRGVCNKVLLVQIEGPVTGLQSGPSFTCCIHMGKKRTTPLWLINSPFWEFGWIWDIYGCFVLGWERL